MLTAKITSKGQITLPLKIRQRAASSGQKIRWSGARNKGPVITAIDTNILLDILIPDSRDAAAVLKGNRNRTGFLHPRGPGGNGCPMEPSLFTKFIRKYQKGDVVFEENTRGREMFIIHTGRVKISINGPAREHVLAVLGPGEVFGEMALVDNSPRSATAVVEQNETDLVVVDHPKFFYLINQQPAFALTLLHILAQRIRELERQLAHS